MSNIRVFLAVFVLCSYWQMNVEGLFRMSKVVCEATDPTYVKFHYCRLKPIDRNRAELSFKANILRKSLEKVWVHLELMRKSSVQVYRTFIFNYTIDACDFIKNHNKYPLAQIVYNLFAPFTNINHSCPYSGDILMEKFSLSYNGLPYGLPNAEYIFKTDWLVDDAYRFKVHVWFVFEERNISKRFSWANF